MNEISRLRIKHAANADIVRRKLIQYFMENGFDSFDKSVNPAALQVMPEETGLYTKLEIVPHAVEIDPSTGRGVLGWNLFVLGNQRMYLGETIHESLTELARQIRTGSGINPASTKRCTTPRRIITFITRTLGKHYGGYVDLDTPLNPHLMRRTAYRPTGYASSQGQWFSKAF